MNIYEQPIDKLQQCIENENNRLNKIVDSLYKLRQEYEDKRTEFSNKLADIENQILTLEGSYECAKQFISDCQTQLTKLQQNGETV